MRRSSITTGLTVAALLAAALIGLRLVIPGLASLGAVRILLGGGSLVATAFLISAIKRARAAGDFDISTLLVFGLGWLIALPTAVVVISGNVVRELDVTRELVPVLPGWYDTGVFLCTGIAAGFAALLLVARLISEGRRVKVNAAGLFAMLLWAVAWLASGLQGGRLLSLSGGALLVCLAAATFLPRGRGAALGAGLFGATLAIASGLFGAVNFDLASATCPHTCVLGNALAGIFPNQNLLGTTLIVVLPFIYLGFRGPSRVWLVLFVTAIAAATGSRDAIAAVAIVALALFLLRPSLDADRPTHGRTILAGLLVIGALLPSVYIVMHDWSSTPVAAEDRPQIWTVATKYRHDSPVVGYGPDKWETIYTQNGEIRRTAQTSTHNQWVDVIFVAGWLGAALLAAMIVTMLWSAGYARAALLIVLTAAFLAGATDTAWSVGTVDLRTFSLVALILLGPAPAARPIRVRAGPPRLRGRAPEPVPTA